MKRLEELSRGLGDDDDDDIVVYYDVSLLYISCGLILLGKTQNVHQWNKKIFEINVTVFVSLSGLILVENLWLSFLFICHLSIITTLLLTSLKSFEGEA